MKVLINNCSVDFEIDEEKNLKELMGSIMKWTGRRDLIFTNMYVDGEQFSLDSLPDRDIDKINEINCEVHSKADLIISTINEAVSYCDKILSYVKNSSEAGQMDFTQKSSLENGIDWLLDTSQVIFTLLGIDEKEVKYLDHPLTYYFSALAVTRDSINQCQDESSFVLVLTEQKNLFETVRAVFKMLFLSENLRTIVIKSIESPNNLIDEIKRVRVDIAVQVAYLENAAIAFQSGRDAEGADILQGFIDFIYRFIRVCHQISPVFGLNLSELSINGKSIEEHNALIYSFLEEIVAVMENGDIISLSDILEYQMKPELEKTMPFIDLLLEKLS